MIVIGIIHQQNMITFNQGCQEGQRITYAIQEALVITMAIPSQYWSERSHNAKHGNHHTSTRSPSIVFDPERGNHTNSFAVVNKEKSKATPLYYDLIDFQGALSGWKPELTCTPPTHQRVCMEPDGNWFSLPEPATVTNMPQACSYIARSMGNSSPPRGIEEVIVPPQGFNRNKYVRIFFKRK
jgi:hypothetical protein